jgi:tetratricopeptide (TPR) repeat protein
MRGIVIFILILLTAAGCTSKMAVVPSGREMQRGADSRYDYILAEALRQKYVGDVNEAATLFGKCIELDRDRAVPYFELAQMYSSAGIGDKAMMYASRAARLEPSNYWYQMAGGSLFTQYNIKDSALVYFARALKADPSAVEVNGILAGLYAERGDMVRADSLLRRLDSEGGLTEEMALMMISGLMVRDQFREAAERTLRLIQQHPGETRYQALLADIYFEDDRKEKSDSIYREIIEKNPDDIESQLLYMMNLVFRKEYGGISAFLNNIFESEVVDRNRKVSVAGRLATDTLYVRDNWESLAKALLILESEYPDDEEIMSIRPTMLEVADRRDEAILRYEQLIATGGPGFYFKEKLLILYTEKKEYRKVFDLAASYSRENNRSILGKIYYAMAAMELKEYQVADAELKKAMILAGNDNEIKVQVMSMLGDLKYRMKDYEASYKHYEEALVLSPDDPLLLNNYAYFLAEGERDLRKALKMAERVMMLDGGNPTYIDTYAWVLYKLGKYREAQREMIRIMDKGDEQDPELLEHMGFIKMKLGRCSEAVEFWRKALEGDKSKGYLEEEIRKCTRD